MSQSILFLTSFHKRIPFVYLRVASEEGGVPRVEPTLVTENLPGMFSSESLQEASKQCYGKKATRIIFGDTAADSVRKLSMINPTPLREDEILPFFYVRTLRSPTSFEKHARNPKQLLRFSVWEGSQMLNPIESISSHSERKRGKVLGPKEFVMDDVQFRGLLDYFLSFK